MSGRVLSLFCALATVTLVALVPLPVATQGSTVPPLIITAYNGGPPINYVAPKTPWGEAAAPVRVARAQARTAAAGAAIRRRPKAIKSDRDYQCIGH